MKRTYIIPATSVLNADVQMMIATSPAQPQVTISRNAEDAVNAADVEVKRNSYDVWKDKWSE